jgi:hypothetical protein
MEEHKFDKVTGFGKDQADAGERLKYAAPITKYLTARELKRFLEVLAKEPIKVAFAKKAIGL